MQKFDRSIDHVGISTADLESRSLEQLLLALPAISHILDPVSRARVDKRALDQQGYLQVSDALMRQLME